MSLLRDIQSDSINNEIPTSTILRKCMILGARLGHDKFLSWVDQELNGYQTIKNVPDYRQMCVQSYGHFVGIAGSEAQNMPIPPSNIPAKYRKMISYDYFMDPIAYYESLLKQNNRSENLQSPWPADLVKIVQSEIYTHMNLVKAYKLIPFSSVAALVDTIRNRILKFAIDIESQNPEAGEAPINSNPIPIEKVSQIFQTNIYGNVTNLATGYIAGDINISVVQNDLASLKSYMESIGITADDSHTLQKAIKSDELSKPRKQLGSNVKQWIEQMGTKAKKGIWQIGSQIGVQLLTKAISMYYGID